MTGSSERLACPTVRPAPDVVAKAAAPPHPGQRVSLCVVLPSWNVVSSEDHAENGAGEAASSAFGAKGNPVAKSKRRTRLSARRMPPGPCLWISLAWFHGFDQTVFVQDNMSARKRPV